ncbi:E3 ubiquitin-protein ligase TRIM7 [Diretmus argenteus]
MSGDEQVTMLTYQLKKKVCRMLWRAKDLNHTELNDFSLDESKLIIRELAVELDRIIQDSVCLGEGVCEVVQDLENQWKRGKLANMLPVMDFMIWSLLQQEAQEPNVTFLTEITLNPSTANPSLKLSQDRKAVKMDQIIESLNNPWDGFSATKAKFDGWWCVLGSRGFDSGRHYWEVDVRGKREWRIGVVRESSPRNGFVALNSTAGYWTLRLQLGQLLAMTAPVTKLDRSAPGRLGVFLDMEEGQVSFYDAGERRHIYTFDVDCDRAEKIYPVFGTIETDTELRILNN